MSASGTEPGQTDKPLRPAPSTQVVGAMLDLWKAENQELEVPIRGGSMRPLLREGDAVRVRPQALGYRPGDIVVFRAGQDLIAHRLLRRIPDGKGGRLLITQGDRCPRPDPSLPESAALGKVTGIRRAGRLIDLGGRWQGWRNRMAVMVLRLRSYRFRLAALLLRQRDADHP